METNLWENMKTTQIEIDDNSGTNLYLYNFVHILPCYTQALFQHYYVHYGHNGQNEVMMFHDGNAKSEA